MAHIGGQLGSFNNIIANSIYDCNFNIFSWLVHGSSKQSGRNNLVELTLPTISNLSYILKRYHFKEANLNQSLLAQRSSKK